MAVNQAIEADPSLELHRDLLVDRLVQALESDASWVELYGVTGELIVPEIIDEEGDIGSALLELKQVCLRIASCQQVLRYRSHTGFEQEPT